MLSNLSMTLGSCVKAIDDALNVVQDLIPITADPRKGCELSHETAHVDQVRKEALDHSQASPTISQPCIDICIEAISFWKKLMNGI